MVGRIGRRRADRAAPGERVDHRETGQQRNGRGFAHEAKRRWRDEVDIPEWQLSLQLQLF